jgi:hypothetical protein
VEVFDLNGTVRHLGELPAAALGCEREDLQREAQLPSPWLQKQQNMRMT